MTTQPKVRARALAACISLAFATTATAGIPVIDIANDASNFVQNVQLAIISHQLGDRQVGTVNYYNNNISNNSTRISKSTNNIDRSTTQIDKSTTNIDKSTTNIDKSTTEIANTTVDIKNHTNNIDVTTVDIQKTTNLNYEIDANFTWIINNGDNEVIPIPDPIRDAIVKIKNGHDTDTYLSSFRSAEDYSGAGGGNADAATSGFEGSRARKAANDMLVKSLDAQMDGLTGEGAQLSTMVERIGTSQGHGHQLQVANVLAGTQVDQTMKLRSMLLASESARAAEAQALADQDARAIATGKQLREGLADFLRKATPRAPMY
jgi:conjugal transfer/entry exclusion protein